VPIQSIAQIHSPMHSPFLPQNENLATTVDSRGFLNPSNSNQEFSSFFASLNQDLNDSVDFTNIQNSSQNLDFDNNLSQQSHQGFQYTIEQNNTKSANLGIQLQQHALLKPDSFFVNNNNVTYNTKSAQSIYGKREPSPQPSFPRSPQPAYARSPQPDYAHSPQPAYAHSPQPAYAHSPQPAYGGLSPQPSYRGTSPQPSFGGLSPQPSHRGTSPQPQLSGPNPQQNINFPNAQLEGQNGSFASTEVSDTGIPGLFTKVPVGKFWNTIKQGDNTAYQCPYPDCCKIFTRPYNLKSHYRGHTGERPFVCDAEGCVSSFSRKHDLRRHQKLHG
jgi:uncharacterized Zn-finger protein